MQILSAATKTQVVSMNKKKEVAIDWKSAREIADYFKVSRSTIHTWSYMKNDPLPFRKILGVIQYDFELVKAWESRNMVKFNY